MLKTPTNNSFGLTMVEVLATMAIIILLFSASITLINPVELKARGRDEKRLADMSTLDRAIVEYSLDNSYYPGLINTFRVSTVVPLGNAGPVNNPVSGWIDADLSSYTSRLPTDPLNDAVYRYSYQHTQSGYEINAVLEHYSEYSLNTSDGGDDNNVYELGNQLDIL